MTETKKHVGTSTQPRTFKKLSRLKLAPRKVQAATIQDGESSIEVRSILSTSRSNMTSSSSGSMIGAVRKRHKSEMTSESISCRVTSEQQLGETSEKSVTYDSNNYKKTPRYFIPKLFEIWAPQLCPSYRANVKNEMEGVLRPTFLHHVG
ncbi:hypothetical protein LOTGIDRAFT_157851 [Lottia gigantea]|uniref:Uncharacterized protein n=1 Tax=Lottia gigantea TaxID=225164 RepID=V4CF03_LOTGI|nr:hypothetical protein LOTGIDRAFT_157851 [Lottia gigantea]ESP00575.1 hypothetical protein LOTGIDRAFT_157851 [Lottia gigantea]